MLRVGWIICVLLAVGASRAGAQTDRQPPDRARGRPGEIGPSGAAPPTDGLDLMLDFVGGYDDNVLPQGQPPTEDGSAAFRAGYTTATQATLRYGRGREANKFLRATGSGSLGHLQLGSDFETARTVRADVSTQAAVPLGRRTSLMGSVGVGYQPAMLYGPFTSLEPGAGPQVDTVDPTAAATGGPLSEVTQQRWLDANGSIGVSRHWTSRQRMDLQYQDTRRQPISGEGFNSRTQFVRWQHTWNARERSGVDFLYRFGKTSQAVGDGIEQPVRMQAADVQWRFSVRPSPSTGFSATLGGGADQTRTRSTEDGREFTSILPTAFGSARVDFSENWSTTAEVRRQASILQGVAPEPFSTAVGALRLDGRLSRRLRMSLTGAYSVGESRSRSAGAFEAGLVAAQLQYGLGRHVGLMADGSFYSHQLRDISLAQPTFPTEYRRTSVRVGLTIWLPVYGNR